MTSPIFPDLVSLLGGGAAVGASAGGVFFMVKWLIEFGAGRLTRREARLDEMNEKLLRSMEARLNSLEQRLAEAERLLADCQRKHAESEAEVLKLSALLDGRGIADQKAQQIIAANELARKKR